MQKTPRIVLIHGSVETHESIRNIQDLIEQKVPPGFELRGDPNWNGCRVTLIFAPKRKMVTGEWQEQPTQPKEPVFQKWTTENLQSLLRSEELIADMLRHTRATFGASTDTAARKQTATEVSNEQLELDRLKAQNESLRLKLDHVRKVRHSLQLQVDQLQNEAQHKDARLHELENQVASLTSLRDAYIASNPTLRRHLKFTEWNLNEWSALKPEAFLRTIINDLKRHLGVTCFGDQVEAGLRDVYNALRRDAALSDENEHRLDLKKSPGTEPKPEHPPAEPKTTSAMTANSIRREIQQLEIQLPRACDCDVCRERFDRLNRLHEELKAILTSA